nr:transposase domain-containing protein [Xenorhabdus indica]
MNYPESLDAFSQNIPMEWVTEVVKETGRATVRKRRFPAEQAVWLVPGIGLMRNRSINDVCDKLDLAFPDAKGGTAVISFKPYLKSPISNWC